MSILTQQISRRTFLKQATLQFLTVTSLAHLSLRTQQKSVFAAPVAAPYGSGSYGTLIYGQPLELGEPTPGKSDSQIFLPMIMKEAE